MKYLTLFLFCFVFISANAQFDNLDSVVENFSSGEGRSHKKSRPDKEGLSETEFVKLKEAFVGMLNSEIYTQVKKSHREITKKKDGLEFPDPSKDKQWLADLDYTKTWLANNIEKTKFGSVDEAFSAVKESFNLTQKLTKEYADIYMQLKKTSNVQLFELIEIERKYNRQRE